MEIFCAAPDLFVYTEENIRLAKRYAYHFFFDYPFPYPWHLLQTIGDREELGLEFVLSEEGLHEYGRAFQYLAGETVAWEQLEDTRK